MAVQDVFYNFVRKVQGGVPSVVFVVGGTVQTVERDARFTEDGELWVTETERENDVWVCYSEQGINATKYVLMADLDGAQFPHKIQNEPENRLDLTSIYVALDIGVNSDGILHFGIISRVDGTNGDIWYFFNAPFEAGNAAMSNVFALRGVPSQVKADMVNGVLQHGLTNARETNVAAVNTGTALDSPAGAASVAPGVGDYIVKAERTSGSFNATIGTFYHSH